MLSTEGKTEFTMWKKYTRQSCWQKHSPEDCDFGGEPRVIALGSVTIAMIKHHD